jgi:hypothetical protein
MGPKGEVGEIAGKVVVPPPLKVSPIFPFEDGSDVAGIGADEGMDEERDAIFSGASVFEFELIFDMAEAEAEAVAVAVAMEEESKTLPTPLLLLLLLLLYFESM